jgi:pimeloyl-ACP methyl ester carboxylesterase
MVVEMKLETSEGLVDVGGHRLFYRVVGEGAPTVVLECGLGAPSESWAIVQAELAKYTRVFAYDRAGLGSSEKAKEIPESYNVARQLHTLLEKTGQRPPYILVGHSLGGVFIRVYTHLYPDEVGGLVFVDASHPSQNLVFAEKLGGSYIMLQALQTVLLKMTAYLGRIGIHLMDKMFSKGAKDFPPEPFAKLMQYYHSQEHLNGQKREYQYLENTLAQGRTVGNLGSRPVIVLSAGKAQTRGTEKVVKVFQQLHKELSQLSTQGSQKVIDGAEHITIITNRDYALKVVEAIRQVAEKIAARN